MFKFLVAGAAFSSRLTTRHLVHLFLLSFSRFQPSVSRLPSPVSGLPSSVFRLPSSGLCLQLLADTQHPFHVAGIAVRYQTCLGQVPLLLRAFFRQDVTFKSVL